MTGCCGWKLWLGWNLLSAVGAIPLGQGDQGGVNPEVVGTSGEVGNGPQDADKMDETRGLVAPSPLAFLAIRRTKYASLAPRLDWVDYLLMVSILFAKEIVVSCFVDRMKICVRLCRKACHKPKIVAGKGRTPLANTLANHDYLCGLECLHFTAGMRKDQKGHLRKTCGSYNLTEPRAICVYCLNDYSAKLKAQTENLLNDYIDCLESGLEPPARPAA